jgi:hypothetical protein
MRTDWFAISETLTEVGTRVLTLRDRERPQHAANKGNRERQRRMNGEQPKANLNMGLT